jgi:hypothetical protein
LSTETIVGSTRCHLDTRIGAKESLEKRCLYKTQRLLCKLCV